LWRHQREAEQWVGITGQSSIRVMWWKPTVYQATMCALAIDRSARSSTERIRPIAHHGEAPASVALGARIGCHRQLIMQIGIASDRRIVGRKHRVNITAFRHQHVSRDDARAAFDIMIAEMVERGESGSMRLRAVVSVAGISDVSA